uniref:Uncharacterized protein n=1 Tax=Tanacetum cinerariifolium TaxID=118510 RepID=A0A699GZI1_TANCI|nr:hypothetical protein [Tanacetum cinerariifolium]
MPGLPSSSSRAKEPVGIKSYLNVVGITASHIDVNTALRKNDATLPKTQVVNGVTTVLPITTTKEKTQRRLEVKSRSTLVMSIPNEHQLKFNSIKDAKQLLEVVEKRFVNTANEVSTASTQVNAAFSTNVDNLSDAVICAFLASQPNSPRFLKKTRRKLTVSGNETLGFDMSKLECYNCHKKGHFTGECRAIRNQYFKHKESTRRTVPMETPASIALVSCDGLGRYDWSDQAKEGPNYALMAYTTSTSDSKIVDNCKKGLGYESYNVVPPPYTENFMHPKPDLSFTGLDEFVKPEVENSHDKSNEEKTKVVRKNADAPIIEEWVLNNEEEYVAQPKIGNQQMDLQDKGVIDSGCPRHITGNMSYLTDYEEIDRGYVAFGGNPKGGKITGKYTIKTDTKDETSGILKSFITRIENLVDHKVKVIRCDNRAEFKNREMNQFCEMKGILRQYIVARTPQQNKVAERRNKILIEAARTMLADSKLPTTFWAEAVNTACYMQNRVLVVKPHNKTPYEFFHDRTPTLSFMRPFRFSENTPNVVGSGPDWLFDIDALTRIMNYELIVAGTQSKGFACIKDDGFKPSSNDGKKVDEDPSKGSECKDQEKQDNVNNTNNVNAVGSNELPVDPNMLALEDISTFNFLNEDEDKDAVADMNNLETTIQVSPTPTTRIHKDHTLDQVIRDLHSATQTRNMSKNLEEHGFVITIQQRTNHKDLQNCLFACFLSQEEPKKVIHALKDPSWIDATQEELLQFKLQEVWTLVDLPNRKRAIGAKWVFKNKKDERGIVIRNKARLVAQGHTPEEGIDYDEVFSHVVRIEAIRLFIAYASFKEFLVYKMDVKSVFLYGKIKEEVGKFDKKLLIKRHKGDILLVQVYVDDIIFGSTRKELCNVFEKLMHEKFQMKSIGELTFFLGLQVKQKNDGIFISQDKYVAEILKKFGFTKVKNASTLMETQKPLLKDEDGEEVDVHMYRLMMYLTSLRPDIMFAVCACARYQVNPKVSHLHTVKRIFRYLKGQPKLGLWYPKDSSFDLIAYTDSDYAGASLNIKSTTRSCQYLGSRLISWQCKKQTMVANSTTKAE